MGRMFPDSRIPIMAGRTVIDDTGMVKYRTGETGRIVTNPAILNRIHMINGLRRGKASAMTG